MFTIYFCIFTIYFCYVHDIFLYVHNIFLAFIPVYSGGNFVGRLNPNLQHKCKSDYGEVSGTLRNNVLSTGNPLRDFRLPPRYR